MKIQCILSTTKFLDPLGSNDKENIIKTFFKEPLIYFLLIASILFYVNSKSITQKETLTITQPMITFILGQAQELRQKKLSKEEKETLIKQYINNELLYLEAQKQGLDNDSRIKKQMIQKMTLLLTKEVSEPSEVELKEYFELHKEAYASPFKRNFKHIFFAPATTVPKDFLSLITTDETKAKSLADTSLYFGDTFPHMSERDLKMNFGLDAGSQFIDINDSAWHGPIVSILGKHFVKLLSVEPKVYAKFEDVKEYLSRQYIINEHKKQLSLSLDKLREKYTVKVDTP